MLIFTKFINRAIHPTTLPFHSNPSCLIYLSLRTSLYSPIALLTMDAESSTPKRTVHDELRDAHREIKLLQHQAKLFTSDHDAQIAQLESHFTLQLSRAEDLYNHQVSLLQDDLNDVRAERAQAIEMAEEERKRVRKAEKERKSIEGEMDEMRYSLKRSLEESGELRRLRGEDAKRIEVLQMKVENIGRERDELMAAKDKALLEVVDVDRGRSDREALQAENEALKEERDGHLRDRNAAVALNQLHGQDLVATALKAERDEERRMAWRDEERRLAWRVIDTLTREMYELVAGKEALTKERDDALEKLGHQKVSGNGTHF